MTELGAVFAGIIIGVILMVMICAVLFAYAKIMNKMKYFIERERKAYAAMKDRAKRKYDELEARVSALEKTLKRLKETAYDRRIPLMAKCYFSEMHELFSGLKRHLNQNAKLFIDLGDSIFGGVHIPTDLILTEVLEAIGYNFDERIVLRERRSRNNEIVSQVLLKYSYNSNVQI